MSVKTVSFIARSGTGKTTLVEKIITELKQRGYAVGAIKHDAHRFEIDKPGKDSYRFAAAGADATLITSSEKLALVRRHTESPSAEELIETYFSEMDIVLVEGFKQSQIPKIEVHRKELGVEPLCLGDFKNAPVVAIACNGPLPVDIPLLDINRPEEVADFIEENFLR